MGSVLVVGGWVELESDEAFASWKKKTLATAKLTGWAGPIAQPSSGSAFDRWTLGELLAKASEAPEPIEIVESARGVRFAAALASVTGRELWAPAWMAAVRRAAGVGQGAAWAFAASEGGSVLAVDLAGRGGLRELEDDDAIAAALAEPEMVRALALIEGNPSEEGALARLPARVVAPTEKVAPPRRASTTKAATPNEPAPAVRAKPAPRITKLPVRMKTSITGIARRSSGEIVLTSMFGQLARGSLAGAWTTHATSIGKTWWARANGSRIWVGGEDGLYVNEDGDALVARGPRGRTWSDLLFLDGAILGCREGELLRSIDDGHTWTSVFRVEDWLGVGALARGPGEIVVASGLGGRVFVSHDLGASFVCVHAGPSEAFNGLAILGQSAWYVGTSRLVRASLASPGAYERAGPKKPKDVDYVALREGHGTLWLACESQLVRSRDGGATWELVLEKAVVFKDVLPLGARRAIVIASDGHAYDVDG